MVLVHVRYPFARRVYASDRVERSPNNLRIALKSIRRGEIFGSDLLNIFELVQTLSCSPSSRMDVELLYRINRGLIQSGR